MPRRGQRMVDKHGVAHLGTWEWDITQPNATWSSELYRIYGLTPETYSPSYERYLTMVHPDDRQRVIDATNRVFHEHIPYSHDERIFRPDGTIRWLHTWAYPLLDGDGKLTHLIGVCQDITDRATAEEELHKLNIELEARVRDRTHLLETALRELEAFNSMVSHDLRAPLSVIQMSVDLLAPFVADSPKHVVYVERIRRAIRNMSLLMDDLLALARVGQGSLQPTAVDVTAVAHDVLGELRASTPEREVAVTVAPGIACTADSRLFRVALSNLIGNAWKYTTRQSQPRVEIGVAERDGAPALFVRDNGIGFAPEEAVKLFAPFERGKNAAELPGTGIGLAIVQKIVERHGGTIGADAAVGSGATFYVTLPGCSWSQTA